MKKNLVISYLILAIGVIICILLACLGITYNVDSIFDEAFLFYCQQSAFDGYVTGMSQGINIIAAFLGESGCSTILNLRVAALLMKLLCVILFVSITYSFFVKKWKGFFRYVIISVLMLIPHISDIVLCQNGLAQLFLCVSIALGFRILVIDSHWNIFWCFCLGIFLSFGFFSILPSAVLLTVCLSLLLILKYWRTWRTCMLYIFFSTLGIGVGVFFMHWFVCDITDVCEAMIQTASTVTTLNRGYDPLSFLLKIFMFLRDWGLCVIVLIGILYLTSKVKNLGYKWISALLCIGLSLVYMYCQEKPKVTISMLMSIMWILPLFNSIDNKSIFRIKWFTFDTILNVFLVFSPLILSIGTNTYLGGKMSYFMLPWALLLYRIGWDKEKMPMRIEVCVVIAILLINPLMQLAKPLIMDQVEVESGPLKGMHLTNKQEMHYKQCEKIVSDYNFTPGESVIYSTQSGMMTICYLDGVNCANYFQPMDFVTYANIDNLRCPDFLFLSSFDEECSGDALENMGWGWPDEFDVYEVGTPETRNMGYSTDRKLYCRKNLKLNNNE